MLTINRNKNKEPNVMLIAIGEKRWRIKKYLHVSLQSHDGAPQKVFSRHIERVESTRSIQQIKFHQNQRKTIKSSK